MTLEDPKKNFDNLKIADELTSLQTNEPFVSFLIRKINLGDNATWALLFLCCDIFCGLVEETKMHDLCTSAA